MATLDDYFRYAETAFAAYANGLMVGQGNSAQYQAADMAPDQAQQFDASWRVLAQQDLSDGFSAVLFQHASTGEKVLAIRGTEASHWGIDYLADVVNIAILGTNVGASQYDSLEAFYQSLIGSGKLTASEQVTLTGHSLGGFLAQSFTAMHDSAVSETYTYNSPGFSVSPGFVSNIGTQLLELFGITEETIPNSKIFNVRAVDGLSATAGLGQMLGSIQPVRIEPGDPIHNHSIATLSDSLAVYDLFARLGPSLSVDAISELLLAASSDPGTTLERAVSAVAAVFGMPEVNAGNRDALYERVVAIQQAVETATAGPSSLHYSVQSLVGSALGAASLALAEGSAAGVALAYRYTLHQLNSFAVLVTDDSGAVEQADTQSLYAAHETALALYDDDTGTGVITETYLQQRAEMLSWLLFLNREDETTGEARGQIPVRYEDRESGVQIQNGSTGDPRRVLFGTADSFVPDVLEGGTRRDFLFGASGSDTLVGLGGSDYLEGGAGSDYLDGGAGADTLLGMSGADALYGGSLVGSQFVDDLAVDTLDGGVGADEFYAWNSDIIRNPDSSDRVYINGSEAALSLDPANVEAIADRPGLYRDRTSGIEFRWTDTDGDGTRDRLEIFGSYVQVSGFENGDLGIDLTEGAGPVPSNVFVGQEDYDNILVYDPDEGSNYPDGTHQYVVVDNLFGGGGTGSFPDRQLQVVYGLGGDDSIAVDSIVNVPGIILDGGDGNDLLTLDFNYHSFTYYGYDGYGGGNDGYVDPRPAQTAPEIAHGGYLFGGNGNDRLDGSFRGDFLDGGNDDDRVFGYRGDDVMFGGSGNDLVEGHEGKDVLFGGDGNDMLRGDARGSIAFGGPRETVGDDDVIYGGAGDDELHGDDGADSLYGGDGTDALFGDAGNDALDGGAGADQLVGGAGQDVLSGGNDGDSLFGQESDDELSGGAGSDQLVAGDGNDVASGDDGDDVIFGDFGDDILDGGAGTDFLYGGGQHDRLAGGTGDDQLSGGDGDDALLGEDGVDILFGEVGDDTLDGGAGGDQLVGGVGLDILSGGDDADQLFGEADNDQLAGGSGNDELVAGDGDDTADGGDGDDLLFGDAGEDQLRGGAGNDHLQGGMDLDALYGEDGADVLLGEDGADTLLGGAGIDELQGGAGNDRLSGGADADELYGDDGDDVLSGDNGDDLILGDAGADQLSGGAGTDELQGGLGDDVYRFNLGDGWDKIFESGDTQGDTIVLGAGIVPSDVAIARRGSSLTFFVFEGGDQLTIANWFSNTQTRIASVTFSDGTVWTQAQIASIPIHTYLGTSGHDVISDGTGDDQVLGYEGDDTLYGNYGFNQLVGGTGNDTITLGGGTNTISISAGDGKDTIVNAANGYSVLGYSGVTATDLEYDRSGNNLLIGRPGGEQTVVRDWFVGQTLDEILFADGSIAPSNAAISTIAQNTSSNYVVPAGAPTAVLVDWGGTDSVTFGEGIIPEQLTMLRHGVDLVVRRTDAGGATQDLLRASNWFDGTNRQIEEFRFTSSAAVLTAAAITAPLLNPVGTAAADTFVSGIEFDETLAGAGGNDNLTGNGTGYTLLGGDGDDRLTGNGTGTADGGAGSDTLIGIGTGNTLLGGAGNDGITANGSNQTIIGGSGNDTINNYGNSPTYIFNPGDGQDVISSQITETFPNYGELRLGYSFQQTTISGVGSGRVITFAGTTDSIQFGSAARIVFTLTGSGGNDTLVGNDDVSEVINGLVGDDVLRGGNRSSNNIGDYDDELHGGDGNDVLDGGGGVDLLDGGAGNDTLGGAVNSEDFLWDENSYRGGTGDDLLQGTWKADSYHYDLGDGRDTIVEVPYFSDGYNKSSEFDSVYFAEGIESAQLTASKSGSDLVLNVGATGSITFQAWFTSVHNQVERFYFQIDGQLVRVWANTDLTRMALTQFGTSGADTMTGDGIYGDTLYGLGGNDDLSGNGGPDVLEGGTGDDILRGGSGNDTYVFGSGFGRDLIVGETSTSDYDKVQFSTDLSASEISVGRRGNDLVLSVTGTSDELSIQNGLLSSGSRVEGFVFADGSQLPSLDQMVASLVNIYGTTGDDVLAGSAGYDNLFGLDGNDTLRGNGDNDRLEGGAGNDRYVYATDDGVDTIVDSQGTNILDLSGVDLTSASVSVAWDGSANTLMFGLGAGSVNVVDGLAGADRQLLVVPGGSQISFVDWLAQRQATGLVVTHTGGNSADLITGLAGADIVNSNSGNDTLHGGGGDDSLNAGSSDDQLFGELGNDSLYGGSGNDLMEGGNGNDNLYGNYGADEYRFSRGHGQDTISELSTTELNVIRFESDVSLADLQITRSGADLIILNTRTNDRVTTQGYQVNSKTSVPFDVYVGNDFIGAGALAAQADVIGTASANTLRGSSGSDRLYGGAGNDTLDGKAGADLLYGGAGNDRLLGGAGADIYMFSQGWGAETLSEAGVTDGAVDAVLFGEGVLLADLWFARSGTSLQMGTIAGSDTLTIEGWYSNSANQIEQFRDIHGNVLLNTQIEQLVQASATFSPMSANSSTARSASAALHLSVDWLAASPFNFHHGRLNLPSQSSYSGSSVHRSDFMFGWHSRT